MDDDIQEEIDNAIERALEKAKSSGMSDAGLMHARTMLIKHQKELHIKLGPSSEASSIQSVVERRCDALLLYTTTLRGTTAEYYKPVHQAPTEATSNRTGFKPKIGKSSSCSTKSQQRHVAAEIWYCKCSELFAKD